MPQVARLRPLHHAFVRGSARPFDTAGLAELAAVPPFALEWFTFTVIPHLITFARLAEPSDLLKKLARHIIQAVSSPSFPPLPSLPFLPSLTHPFPFAMRGREERACV